MSDNQDPLKQLWHCQEVLKPNLNDVIKKWRKVRLKQRSYVALDFFSLTIPFIIIWFKSDQLDKFTMALLFGVMSVSVLMVFYITWLRRFSLGWSNVTTDQHIQRIQKQIQSNIKIATLSLHSVWFVVVLMIVFYGALYYFDVYPEDKWMRKVLISGAINAVAMPCIWIWAARRKKRFSNELAELNQLLQGTNN